MDDTENNTVAPNTGIKNGRTGDTASSNSDPVPDRSIPDEHATAKDKTGSKTKKFLQRLHRHMAAVAYAEAGEYQSARELVEYGPRSKTVLLVIEGKSSDPASFSHALSLCKRTGGDLVVLQVMPFRGGKCNKRLTEDIDESAEQRAALVQRAHSAGVAVEIVTQSGEVNENLFDYAKRHKDVAMVILDSPQFRAKLPKDMVWKRLAEAVTQELSIPLITVMPKDLEPA
jgi:hypothetical protein